MEHPVVGTYINNITAVFIFNIKSGVTGVAVNQIIIFSRSAHQGWCRVNNISQTPCIHCSISIIIGLPAPESRQGFCTR